MAADDFWVSSVMSFAPLRQGRTHLLRLVPTRCPGGFGSFRHPVFLRDWLNQQIRDKANYQESGHHMHYGLVGAGFVRAMRDLIFPHVVHQHRTKHTLTSIGRIN
jgi:hypothetical protein